MVVTLGVDERCGVAGRARAGETAALRRRLAGAEAEVRLLHRQVALDGERLAAVEADNARVVAEVERRRARLEAARLDSRRLYV